MEGVLDQKCVIVMEGVMEQKCVIGMKEQKCLIVMDEVMEQNSKIVSWMEWDDNVIHINIWQHLINI